MSDSGSSGGKSASRTPTSFRSFSAKSAREALSNSAAASVCEVHEFVSGFMFNKLMCGVIRVGDLLDVTRLFEEWRQWQMMPRVVTGFYRQNRPPKGQTMTGE